MSDFYIAMMTISNYSTSQSICSTTTLTKVQLEFTSKSPSPSTPATSTMLIPSLSMLQMVISIYSLARQSSTKAATQPQIFHLQTRMVCQESSMALSIWVPTSIFAQERYQSDCHKGRNRLREPFCFWTELQWQHLYWNL